MNLILNGAEAMDAIEGTKELRATTRRSAAGGIGVAVRDSGIGINPLDMTRMFDPFFTTKPAGMGMGLSISRTIIEAHGGRIRADPNNDGGLTVRFELPGDGAGAVEMIM
jgi:signal transduction histidine kinase